MNIVVCVKFVRRELVEADSGDGKEYVMNPYDLYALEMAVRCKAVWGCHITCISMGGDSIKSPLSKCLAFGADDVVWLKDPAFAGSDTVATSNILYHAVRDRLDCDCILCGELAVDGETGQVPAGLAEHLNMRFVPGVKDIIDINENIITIKTVNKNMETVISVGLPAVLSFRDFLIKPSVRPSLLEIKKARNKAVTVHTREDLGLSPAECGLNGSKTKVLATEFAMHKKESIQLTGDSMRAANIIHDMIVENMR